jgi:hypothetical protein
MCGMALGPPGLPTAAAPALAGEYQLSSDCIGGAPGELFVASNTDAGTLTTTQTCPTSGGQESGLHVGMVKGALSPYIADGAHAEYRFRTVAGTAITAISYRRSFGQFGGDGDTIPALRNHTGAIVAGETCQTPLGSDQCNGGSTSTLVQPVAISGLNTSSLSFGLQCFAQAPTIVCGSSGPGNEAAWFTVYSAVITISETTAPSLGSTSGSLTGGGWLHGAHTLALSSATDPSGIASATLAIDADAPIGASAGGPDACSFTRPKPCNDLSGTSWSIDTARLPDGAHSATITTRNAADVPAATTPVSFKVDNTPPPAPLALASSAGVDWQGSNSTHLTWTLPPEGQGSPTTAAFTAVCDRNGLNCSPETPSASLTSTDVAVSATASASSTLKVRLEDAAGRGPSATIPFRYSAGAPPAPTAMASSASAWQSSRRIDVTWVPPASTPDQAPVVAGLLEVCDEDGSHCRTAQPVGPAGGTIDVPGEGAFQLRGRVVNAAGQTDPAQFAETLALYSSTAPTITLLRHDPVAASTSRRYSVEFRAAPGGPAPLSTTRWQLCHEGGGCVARGETTGALVTGDVPRSGSWRVVLTAIDQAGRSSVPTESHFVFVDARRLSPGLAVHARLRTGRLRIRIQGDRRLDGSVRGQFRYRIDSGRRAKTVTVRLRRGVGQADVRLPPEVRRGLLAVRFSGSSRFRSQRLQLTLRQAAPTVRNGAPGSRRVVAFEGAFGRALHR